jgi:TctA family transporter
MLSDGSFAVFLQRPLALGMLAIAGLLMLVTLLPHLARRREQIFSEATREE